MNALRLGSFLGLILALPLPPSAAAQPARVIGSPVAGCIAGAVPLPSDGPGYQAIRISRHRYFGHGDTVAFVERLGKAGDAAGLRPFYVGDMSLPHGGPMPWGHGSHQNGLDVDIWFSFARPPLIPAALREDVDLPSMLRPDRKQVDRRRFGRDQAALLRLAATDPHTDRIFVHWAIKDALCANPANRPWLHRIRPWWGHDEHFHVRLRCPADSPDCVGQSPIPPGDGCDAALDWWAEQPEPAPLPPDLARKRPQRPLPAACAAVVRISGPGG